ncbi:MAG: hypothetical protein Ct9H300mP28_12100 [Pseudomonadota bacterium]|nr:MAG: hypothetical protein Ct9H300mP28_12100 [Pseudomonadota bacterium]
MDCYGHAVSELMVEVLKVRTIFERSNAIQAAENIKNWQGTLLPPIFWTLTTIWLSPHYVYHKFWMTGLNICLIGLTGDKGNQPREFSGVFLNFLRMIFFSSILNLKLKDDCSG